MCIRDSFATVLTDDPSVVGTMDPTITPADNATCTLPALNATINAINAVSYTHLRAHETVLDLVCRLLLEKKKQKQENFPSIFY
mgnify:CR=1 FL=1